MKTKEIHPEGNYKNWCPSRLEALQTISVDTMVGEVNEFENDNMIVWSIVLKPKQKLPFHTHTKNYNWTCLIEGKAVSHYANGRIVEIVYQKGDLSFYDHDSKGDFTHDLENIGDTDLKFITVEYK